MHKPRVSTPSAAKSQAERQPIASVGDLFDTIALEEQRRPQIGMLKQ